MRNIPVIPSLAGRWRYIVLFAGLAGILLHALVITAAAQEMPVYREIPSINYDRPPGGDGRRQAGGYALPKQYLGTYVNDSQSEIIAEFVVRENGHFLIKPQELREVGLMPAIVAQTGDGLIDITQLPHVVFDYDEEQQTIRFRTLDNSALVPTEINLLQGRRAGRRQSLPASRVEGDEPVAGSDFGALVNYAIYADSGSRYFSNLWRFQGMAGQLEGRAFGPMGTASSNHIVRFSSGTYQDTIRLESYWSYWDPERLTSYTAGDFINRGLSWTRPVRMGGFQWRRNFGVRSDLVTMPLPSVSGSAAVPSSVDVYINNLRRNSAELPAGPYRLTDFPVVTGANEARLVVKDALGRETVTEVPFYASIDMLAKGLADFSVEGGFLRYDFGTRDNEYGHDFAATGTLRYGFTDTLTLETHGEYTSGFYNGGAGAVFSIGALGVASVSGAASHYHGKSGQQAAVSLEMERWGVRFNARSQRAFGRYNDLASATARRVRFPDWDVRPYDDVYYDNYYFGSNRPVKSLEQLSIGAPLRFDPTTLNISYTRGKYYDAPGTELLSFSASRNFGRRVFGYTTAFKDLKRSDAYGLFAGVSINFDNNIQLSSGVTHDREGTSYHTELSKYITQEIGSTGWRLRDVEGAWRERLAYGSYRSRIARFSGSVEENRDHYRVTAEAEGAIVAAGGGVFAANRIDDSFAVVDVGAPGVQVLRENTPYGRTGWNGKLIVPDLVSYQPTKLSINADEMPLNSIAVETSKKVMSAYRTGIVTRFDVESTQRSALIAVMDESGAPVELGSLVETGGGEEKATIGYDGQTLLPLDGMQLPAAFLVKRTYGGLCRIVIPRRIALGGLDSVTQIHCTEDFQ